MNKIFFLLFGTIIFVTAKAQSNYDEAVMQGDDAFKNGQFKLAVNKYFAAEAFDPTKKDIVKEKLRQTFDRIDALREAAIDSKKFADSALTAAQAEKKFADSALEQTKKQKLLADSALKEAEIQKRKADSNFNSLQELKKTVIGAKYQGGVVFYWSDNTGKHGLIAAETDLGEFNWKQAKDTCAHLSLNGYSDWRLPTDAELVALYANRNVVGGFQLALYWSSSEFNQLMGFCESFDYGVANNYNLKSLKYRVRAVRSF